MGEGKSQCFQAVLPQQPIYMQALHKLCMWWPCITKVWAIVHMAEIQFEDILVLLQ